MKNMLMPILNPSDIAFYDKAYRVTIGYNYDIDCIVIADCEGDALDTVIDSLDKEKQPGYFIDDCEYVDNEDYDEDSYISGGNYGYQLSFTIDELRIQQVDINTYYAEYSES